MTRPVALPEPVSCLPALWDGLTPDDHRARTPFRPDTRTDILTASQYLSRREEKVAARERALDDPAEALRLAVVQSCGHWTREDVVKAVVQALAESGRPAPGKGK